MRCGQARPARVCLFLSLISGQYAMLQAAQCGVHFNFFPPGAEDRNVPAAWGKTAQMAAGNMADDIVYAVVLKGSLNVPGTDAVGIPTLQVVPDHPLLQPGLTGVTRSCLGFPDLENEEHDASSTAAARYQAPLQNDTEIIAASDAASTRRLLEVQLSSNGSSWSSSSSSAGGKWHPPGSGMMDDLLGMAMPQQMLQGAMRQRPEQQHLQQRQWRLGQHPSVPHWRRALQEASGTVTSPAAFRVEYQLNGTAPMSLGQFSEGLQPPHPTIVLDRLQSMEDGYYCLMVTVTLVASTGTVDGVAAPVRDISNTTQVCFYKLDGQPSGRVDFQSCMQSFSVIISEVQPSPIPLYVGSSELLYKPVVHFFSELNRTQEGLPWPAEDVPKTMDHWLTVDTPIKAGRPYIWVPEERLAEGWYNIWLEVGLATKYPTLIALGNQGGAVYADQNAPEAIRDLSKLMAKQQYRNGTVLGIQHRLTQFKALEGPEGNFIPVGSEISFTWDFEGFGHMYCYIDRKHFENSGERTCRPPVNIHVPDKKNHTFTVVMQDACGNPNMTVVAQYGTWGYRVAQVPNTTGFEAGSQLDDFSSATEGQLYDIAASNKSSSTLRSTRAREINRNSAGSISALGAKVGRLLVWMQPALVMLVWHGLLQGLFL